MNGWMHAIVNHFCCIPPNKWDFLSFSARLPCLRGLTNASLREGGRFALAGRASCHYSLPDFLTLRRGLDGQMQSAIKTRIWQDKGGIFISRSQVLRWNHIAVIFISLSKKEHKHKIALHYTMIYTMLYATASYVLNGAIVILCILLSSVFAWNKSQNNASLKCLIKTSLYCSTPLSIIVQKNNL